MNEYLSAAELAQLNILSLPKTPKGISDKAKRECWSSRKRAQRGGGMEYQVCRGALVCQRKAAGGGNGGGAWAVI